MTMFPAEKMDRFMRDPSLSCSRRQEIRSGTYSDERAISGWRCMATRLSCMSRQPVTIRLVHWMSMGVSWTRSFLARKWTASQVTTQLAG